MLIAGLTALFASSLVAWLIIQTEDLHGRHTSDSILDGPQKINPIVTPRVGGVAILTGLLAGAWVAGETGHGRGWWLVLVLASLPAFAGGLIEDLTKRFTVSSRLITTFVAAGFGFFLLDARISEVEVVGVDYLLGYTLASFILTLFAVGGFAHAMNIIDGFNGLSGVVALMMLASLAAVAVHVSDTAILHACIVIGGAVLGFLFFNYPRGLIFAGDAGAYLMGFLIAELAVMLVHRNSEVSPWFPLLLLFYPVWETLFSAYRRKLVRGHSPGAPDALHMHTLVYRRLVRWMDGDRSNQALLTRNALTAPYLWLLGSLTVLPATLFWYSSEMLQACVLLFAVFYVWLYRRIVRFKTPRGLILRAGKSSNSYDAGKRSGNIRI